LEEARRTEWEYRKELDFVPHSQFIEKLKSMNEEILQASTAQEQIRARLVEVDAELVRNTAALPASLGSMNNDVVNNLVEQLNALLEEKITLGVEYQPAHPDLQELEAEIQDKQAAVLDAVQMIEGDGDMPNNVWQQRQYLYQQKLDLQLKLTDLEVQRATIEKIRQERMKDLPALANKSFEHEQLEQRAAHYQKEFDLLLSQKLSLETTLSRGSGRVEWNEPVTLGIPFQGGASRRFITNFGIGGFVGFVVGFALAMIWESIDTSIRSAQDINEYIGLEVIGTIPKMKFGTPSRWGSRFGTYVALPDETEIDACIVTQHDPKSPVSEAYRQLRTNFLLETVQLRPRTIMITSAVPAEGKTTTAVNMAVTMADRGMRVVVMDTDLRRPNVHKVLKMERGPGLADVLRGDTELSSVVRPTRIKNLWILSSGRVPPNPSELIGSESMKQVMNRLSKEFDLIICDAPSILVVTDPVLMATHVDSVILVVSVERAKRETVQRARKLMDAAKAHISGVVLNGLEASRRHYYYYYYYYDETSA
jgi:capsular exopolysaccharide synthesis family protein